MSYGKNDRQYKNGKGEEKYLEEMPDVYRIL